MDLDEFVEEIVNLSISKYPITINKNPFNLYEGLISGELKQFIYEKIENSEFFKSEINSIKYMPIDNSKDKNTVNDETNEIVNYHIEQTNNISNSTYDLTAKSGQIDHLRPLQIDHQNMAPNNHQNYWRRFNYS